MWMKNFHFMSQINVRDTTDWCNGYVQNSQFISAHNVFLTQKTASIVILMCTLDLVLT